MKPLKSEWQIFVALAVILSVIASLRDCHVPLPPTPDPEPALRFEEDGGSGGRPSGTVFLET